MVGGWEVVEIKFNIYLILFIYSVTIIIICSEEKNGESE